MKIHPSAYLVVLHGRNVATVCYMRGVLFNVVITTGVRTEVAEIMALLPSLESNIARTEGLQLTPTDDLLIE